MMFKNEPISSQIIIKQQLEAHYKKLKMVKPYIDNRAPYAMYHHPKSRVHLHPSFSARSVNSPIYRNMPIRAITTNPYVEEIMKTLFRSDIRDDSITSRAMNTRRIEGGNSSRSRAHSANLTSSCRDKKSRAPSGDLLERQSQKFTSGKLFTPRTLKSAAVSRIKSLDCYNPPKWTKHSNNLAQTNIGSAKNIIQIREKKSSTEDSKPIFIAPKHSTGSQKSSRQSSPRSQIKRKASPEIPRNFQDDKLLEKNIHMEQTELKENLETEVNFLNFLSSITSDILRQGSFSNAQLNQLFRKQLSDGTSNLSFDLKRRALRQIVEQLNLPSEVSNVIDEPILEDGDIDKQNDRQPRNRRSTYNPKPVIVKENISPGLPSSNVSSGEDSSREDNEEGYISDSRDTSVREDGIKDSRSNLRKSPQLVQMRTPIVTITPAGKLSDDRKVNRCSSNEIKVNKSGDSDVTVPLTEVSILDSDQLSSQSNEVSLEEENNPQIDVYEDDFSD